MPDIPVELQVRPRSCGRRHNHTHHIRVEWTHDPLLTLRLMLLLDHPLTNIAELLYANTTDHMPKLKLYHKLG